MATCNFLLWPLISCCMLTAQPPRSAPGKRGGTLMRTFSSSHHKGISACISKLLHPAQLVKACPCTGDVTLHGAECLGMHLPLKCDKHV